MNAQPRQSYYLASMVSSRIGEQTYSDVLSKLPDRFYSLTDDAQCRVWKVVLAEIRTGERDAGRLALAAKRCQEAWR